MCAVYEYIILFQEKYGFGVVSNFEYSLELLFERIGIAVVNKKLTCRDPRKSARSQLASCVALIEYS